MLHIRLIRQAYPLRCLITLFVFILSSVILSIAVSDFLKNAEELPNIFMIGVSQVLFVILYIWLRLLWKTQILEMENDPYSNLIVDHKYLKQFVWLKMNFFFMMIALHIMISHVVFIVISGFHINIIYSITLFLGSFIMVFMYLFDFLMVNHVAKVAREITFTIVLICCWVLFWYPSLHLFYLIITIFGIIMLLHWLLLRREYDVKNS